MYRCKDDCSRKEVAYAQDVWLQRKDKVSYDRCKEKWNQFKRAYDRIDRVGLWKVLQLYGLDGRLVRV